MCRYRLNFRTILVLLAPVFFCYGPASDFSAAQQDDKNEGRQPIALVPPPADVNDLSMEVAALRTLYLVKATYPQTQDMLTSHYDVIKRRWQGCAQPPRQRRAAVVSKNFHKVLIDLRAAFITNNEDRIGELSNQLEQLTADEEPDLDDGIEITDKACFEGPNLLQNFFEANRIASYIGAYGKDFPHPYRLVLDTVLANAKASRPNQALWEETRKFVAEEVSWQVGGVDPRRRQQVAEKVKKALDHSYLMSPDEIKKGLSTAGRGLRKEIADILSGQGPTDVIKHVLERDFAELCSNPRLMPAMAAREDYLKKTAAAKEAG